MRAGGPLTDPAVRAITCHLADRFPATAWSHRMTGVPTSGFEPPTLHYEDAAAFVPGCSPWR